MKGLHSFTLVSGYILSFRYVQAGLRPASSLRVLSATRLIEVARCARFKPLIKSFMLLLRRVHRDELHLYIDIINFLL